MTRKRKKPESVQKWFKPVSKTSKNDSNELNENTISELATETDKNEAVEHTVAIGDGIEIMPAVINTDNENQVEEIAVIDTNNENQVEEIISSLDNLDIKSKLVKEFKEKLAAHGLMLNSSIDLVSSELDPEIESAILAISCPDITGDIPTNVRFHKFFLIFL